MGISIVQWRLAVGLFLNKRFAIHVILILAMSLLLLLCGDAEINPGPIGKLKYLSLCHSNVRGLTYNRLRDLKVSLADTYDVITLSEIFLSPLNSTDIEIPGFSIICRDRLGFGGGLIVYIKNSIAFKRITTFEIDLIENIWIERSTLDGKLLICNVYRPPNFCDFLVHFRNNIDTVKCHSLSKISSYLAI